MHKLFLCFSIALAVAGCNADSQNSQTISSAADTTQNGGPATFGLPATDATIVASIAAPTIDKVYGRDGVAAIYFTPAQQRTKLSGISFHFRNNCNGQTVPVSESPARITGLPLDTPCAFTAQLVASQGASAFSNVSRTINMSSKKYFGYYNYYHGFQNEAAYTSAFNLDVQKTHGNLVYISYNDYYDPTGPARRIRVFDRIREATEQGMFVVIDIQHLFYARTLGPTGEFVDRRKLRDDWEKQWDDFTARIEPYRNNIAAFYDEEAYWGAALNLENPNEATIILAFTAVNATLTKVSDKIRATHPEIAFAAVEEAQAYAGRFPMINGAGPATMQTCIACKNAIKIPKTVDWIGFEGAYPVTDAGYQNWEGHSIPEYLIFTKERFTSDHQKLVLVPPTFLPTAERPEQIANMQMIVNRFWSLAQNEPRLAAVIPYFWSEEPPTNGIYKRFGLYGQTTPVLRSQFKMFGQCVVNKFAGDCTPTSTPPPPASLPAGIFRVPPSSIYQSDGNFRYCGFLDEPHFNSYSPGVPATHYASYASIPGSMVYQGGCARLPCFYAGGQEPGHSCIWPSASADHGSVATISPISGGTGYFQASCSNGQWQVLGFACTTTPATPPSFPAGPFGYGGNLYYSNGSYHFCSYRNLQHYLSHGNPENFSSLAQLYPFNDFMINDGTCGG